MAEELGLKQEAFRLKNISNEFKNINFAKIIDSNSKHYIKFNFKELNAIYSLGIIDMLVNKNDSLAIFNYIKTLEKAELFESNYNYYSMLSYLYSNLK